jgi:hypothetical protein
MLRLSRLTAALLLAALGGLAGAADAPPPLVKPAAPGNGIRARAPVTENNSTFMHFRAQVHKGGKKGELIDVRVALDTLPNPPQVTPQRLKAWGYEPPASGTFVLPELVIVGGQFAPKPAKGRDVELRIPNLKLKVVEQPGGGDEYAECAMSVSLRDLGVGTDRAAEPRLYFADKFFEVTLPGGAVKKLNTGDVASPDPQATAGELVPAFGAMGSGNYPVFAYAAVNGLTKYTTPTGKVETVNVGVASLSPGEPGVTMTLNTARGCGVVLEKPVPEGGTAPGKVKEFRLGLLTGPGFKAQKDIVIKDLTVDVIDDKSQAFVWLGSRFVEKHFTDGVYGCGSDGVWRLHGRVKPELLEDIKTRPAPPKKP